MEREEPAMQTKTVTQDKTTTAPTAVEDRSEEAEINSPQAFYEKMVKRSDVREILTRLAKFDQEETR